MKRTLIKTLPLVAALALLAACGTPKDIVYLQDAPGGSEFYTVHSEPIRLKPMDQISIIVNGLDPQVSAMFNLPYFNRRIGESQSLTATGNVGVSNQTGQISGYTVDSDGNIDFPVLGKIYVQGKTRAEVCQYVKQLLIDSRQIKDPVVTVEFMNLGFSVLGDVTNPGRYRIDALSLAGDLTINGRRTDVRLIRNSGTDREVVYNFDLTQSYGIYSSPAYYIQQGDLIYVTPNNKRRRESTVLGNSTLTPSFWVSLVSSVTSIATSVALLMSYANK